MTRMLGFDFSCNQRQYCEHSIVFQASQRSTLQNLTTSIKSKEISGGLIRLSPSAPKTVRKLLFNESYCFNDEKNIDEMLFSKKHSVCVPVYFCILNLTFSLQDIIRW